MDKIRLGLLGSALLSLATATASFAAGPQLLQGTNLELNGIPSEDTVILFMDKGAEIRKDSNFSLDTDSNLKLLAGKNKNVVIEHNNLSFNNKEADLTKYGNPKIDFGLAGGFITAESNSINIESDQRIKLIGSNVRVDHNLLSFVSDTKYPVPTIDFALEGAKLTAADGLQVEGRKGLNVQGPLTVVGAMTFSGNQTVTGNLTVTGDTALGDATSDTVTVTGALNITPAATGLLNVLTGNLKVGNGTPDVTLNGEDAYVEGTFEADGAARFDGAVTANAGATIAGAASSINASSNFATNINTGTSTGAVTIGGTAGNTISIGTDNTVADTIGIGSALDNVAITGDDWSVTNAGVAVFKGVNASTGLLQGALGLTITGAAASINASSNFATNINTGTSTGAVTIGGAAGNTISIGTDNTVADTIGIGSALDNVAITGDDWSVTNAGAGTFGSVTATTALVIPNGAAPGATCTAGQIFLDTDETNDTNCTTTNDNSLCLCVATNTWAQLNNN